MVALTPASTKAGYTISDRLSTIAVMDFFIFDFTLGIGFGLNEIFTIMLGQGWRVKTPFFYCNDIAEFEQQEHEYGG